VWVGKAKGGALVKETGKGPAKGEEASSVK
jgi:hypothetical protein